VEHPFLALVLPIAFLGGVMRGFTGFGGPLLVLPVMTMFQPASTAAASVLFMDVFANVQMLPSARPHWSVRVLVPMVAGTLIGIPIGTHALVSLDPAIMRRVIALVVLLAGAVLLLGWRYERPMSMSGYGFVGLVSAAIMGATGLGVVAPLLLNAGAGTAAENRANVIAWVFLATLLMLAIMVFGRVIGPTDLPRLLPLVVAYLIGIAVGCRTYGRASESAVRKAMLLCVIGVAIASLLV
jgi:uncharacterized membrane protein YfcA